MMATRIHGGGIELSDDELCALYPAFAEDEFAGSLVLDGEPLSARTESTTITEKVFPEEFQRLRELLEESWEAILQRPGSDDRTSAGTLIPESGNHGKTLRGAIEEEITRLKDDNDMNDRLSCGHRIAHHCMLLERVLQLLPEDTSWKM